MPVPKRPVTPVPDVFRPSCPFVETLPVNVVTPVLALGISTLYENYTWHYLNLLGLVLVIFGNIIIFRKIYD